MARYDYGQDSRMVYHGPNFDIDIAIVKRVDSLLVRLNATHQAYYWASRDIAEFEFKDSGILEAVCRQLYDEIEAMVEGRADPVLVPDYRSVSPTLTPVSKHETDTNANHPAYGLF